MSKSNGPELGPGYLEWLGVNFLLEGLDALERQRGLTEDEEQIMAVLEELGRRRFAEIYPEFEGGPNYLNGLSDSELWDQAAVITKAKVNVYDLICHRDEEHPRGGCRFCFAGTTKAGG